MILEQSKYDILSIGSHTQVELRCDSCKNHKCLGTFLREKRIVETQRKRTGNKDFCKFCQKTEEFTGRGNPNTKYFFDDDYLRDINTPEKAYLLGWIASDGSITNSTVCISVRDYDVNTLTQLRNIIDSSIPIAETHNMVSFTISSRSIALDCIRHLVLEQSGKKDTKVSYPNISKELDVYFIRGFFEGDGSVSLHHKVPRASIASNSLSMLKSIAEKCGYGNVYESSSGNQWQTTNGDDAINFLTYLYKDISVPYLERKYSRYLELFSWVPSKVGKGASVKFNTTNGLIKFNKARSDAILPTISDIHASGIDLHIIEKVKDFNTDVSLYTTGIKVQPPEGYYFILVGRSSISKSGYSLANAVGIIDENYVGEIMVPLRNHTDDELILPNRLVQLILMPKINCEFTVVDSLEDTQRGTGGFGSTGQ